MFSQNDQDKHNLDGHLYHSHHKNELGIANSPFYFSGENNFSYGLHIGLGF